MMRLLCDDEYFHCTAYNEKLNYARLTITNRNTSTETDVFITMHQIIDTGDYDFRITLAGGSNLSNGEYINYNHVILINGNGVSYYIRTRADDSRIICDKYDEFVALAVMHNQNSSNLENIRNFVPYFILFRRNTPSVRSGM